MIIDLKDDLVLKQDGKRIILEKGDRIQIIKEDTKELIKREGEKEWMRIKRDLDGLLRSNSPGALNKRLEDYFLKTPYFSKGRFVNTDGLDQFQMMFLKRSEDSSLRFKFKKNRASESYLAVYLDVKTKKITKVYFSYQDNDVAKTDFKNSLVYVDVPSNDETVKNLIDYYIETKTLSKTDFVVNKKKYKEDIISVQETVKISQKDHDLILEKGDRIKII